MDVTFFIIPNLIDDNIFKNYKNEKIYDILIYGDDKYKCYNFRKRIKKILKYNPYNWNVKIIEYNEYQKKDLSNEINKSYLSIATCSSFEYFVCKYMEISLSGSLIVCDMPKQGEVYFPKNKYIHIEDSMTDEEICDIINNILKDKEKIIKLIEEQYTNTEFLKGKYFYNYYYKINNIINNK